MPKPQQNKKISFTQWFLIFLISFFVFRYFFPAQTEEPTGEGEPVISDISMAFVPTKEAYTLGETVALNIDNRSTKTYSFALDCPNAPFRVEKFTDGNWVALEATNEKVTCTDTEPENTLHWLDTSDVTAQTLRTISYADWNYALFGEEGKYRVKAIFTEVISAEEQERLLAEAQAEAELHPEFQEVETATGTIIEQMPVEINPDDVIQPEVLELEAQFEVAGRSWFGWLWETIIYSPIYNLLIFIASIIPGHNIGWAIIVLTILIRLVLLMPNQKALRSQRAMQEIQPKLKEIQLKYANDQQKVAQETMALWKKHKINPFGSCLPMFIQLPVLIALFYVVRSLAENFSTSQSAALYGSLSSFDLDLISLDFYGLDLMLKGVVWVAVTVALLQFIQMKLSLAKVQKGDKKEKDPTQAATSTMAYILPFMIGFMAYSFPIAVSFYWATSTLFGIGQQLVVNRQKVL